MTLSTPEVLPFLFCATFPFSTLEYARKEGKHEHNKNGRKLAVDGSVTSPLSPDSAIIYMTILLSDLLNLIWCKITRDQAGKHRRMKIDVYGWRIYLACAWEILDLVVGKASSVLPWLIH